MMLEEKRETIANEIRQLEKELYLKRSILGSFEAMEDTDREPFGRDQEKWKSLIESIGEISTGKNSVEDMRQERL